MITGSQRVLWLNRYYSYSTMFLVFRNSWAYLFNDDPGMSVVYQSQSRYIIDVLTPCHPWENSGSITCSIDSPTRRSIPSL